MLLAVDVHYSDNGATAAGVAFDGWRSSTASRLWVLALTEPPAPYKPGKFYQRELPYLCKIVGRGLSDVSIETIIIDGHVWLTDDQPGLGMHLYEHLERAVPVVGIAKSAYHRGTATPVQRGRSRRPLHVTSAGLEQVEAARLVAEMHGADRLPTIVRLVDSLARHGDTPERAEPGGSRLGC